MTSGKIFAKFVHFLKKNSIKIGEFYQIWVIFFIIDRLFYEKSQKFANLFEYWAVC